MKKAFFLTPLVDRARGQETAMRVERGDWTLTENWNIIVSLHSQTGLDSLIALFVKPGSIRHYFVVAKLAKHCLIISGYYYTPYLEIIFANCAKCIWSSRTLHRERIQVLLLVAAWFHKLCLVVQTLSLKAIFPNCPIAMKW
ncbi:hypothetical protein EJ08DRAFT_409090 [Tothia fuscella]|uniref:Uncharacterized protein n=1 Tax=Tothia fuscella TaxID=1048955 RepID=A0A9P4NKJ6_9PEZI|nr:hypothetical protein EJ08DRAFT_409090 [Tothia fuscella]